MMKIKLALSLTSCLLLNTIASAQTLDFSISIPEEIRFSTDGTNSIAVTAQAQTQNISVPANGGMPFVSLGDYLITPNIGTTNLNSYSANFIFGRFFTLDFGGGSTIVQNHSEEITVTAKNYLVGNSSKNLVTETGIATKIQGSYLFDLGDKGVLNMGVFPNTFPIVTDGNTIHTVSSSHKVAFIWTPKTTSAVPEPTTLVFVILGLYGFSRMRKSSFLDRTIHT